MSFRAFKKALVAPYSAEVNNRIRTTRGPTRDRYNVCLVSLMCLLLFFLYTCKTGTQPHALAALRPRAKSFLGLHNFRMLLAELSLLLVDAPGG